MTTKGKEAMQRIVFTGKQELHLEETSLGEPGAGELRVRTLVSLMSTGTENIVLNRMFDAGTNWDNWVKYPFYPGYALVGQVEALGAGVTGFTVGQRVVLRSGHASHHIVEAKNCFALPDGIPAEQAVWFAMAKISSMGARAAQFQMGESVLVIGAGPIGQMAVRWAFALGCETILCADMVAKRLDFAMRGGASHVIAKPLDEAMDQVKAMTGGRGPRVVIDSTGNAKVFASALKVARDRGRIVVLGDTGSPAGQHLTQDLISRGLSIVGAHDVHEDGDWNAANIFAYFFKLIQSGRFNLEGMNTHEFAPKDFREAYRVANELRGETMGILFRWA